MDELPSHMDIKARRLELLAQGCILILLDFRMLLSSILGYPSPNRMQILSSWTMDRGSADIQKATMASVHLEVFSYDRDDGM
jgi:hypothetical protein